MDQYLIKTTERGIDVIATGSGAIVAFIANGSHELVFDRLAETREVLGLINHEDEFAKIGLDANMIGILAGIPGRDIEPNSCPLR